MQDLKDGGYIALKGFCYQFDKTIADIFDQPKSEVKIEQIQDVQYDDFIVQVKHHDTKYSASHIRDRKKKPIMQLIDLFKKDCGKHYVLYIYLKDVSPGKQTISLSDLDEILSTEASTYSVTEKTDFLKKFTLIQAPDFKSLHAEVISKIKAKYSVLADEAEFLYALISNYLLQIVIANPPSKRDHRKTTLTEVSTFINTGRKVLFNSGFAAYLAKDKYHKHLRKKYFNTTLNLTNYERFFLIEVKAETKTEVLVDLVLSVKNKWQKNGKRVDKPFAPYICFYGASSIQLKELKKQLVSNNYIIKDGYDFQDADFNVTSLIEKVTHENRIPFRIVNGIPEMESAFKAISRTKELYQFYLTEPLEINHDFKHIRIQVEDLADIKTII